MSNVIIIINNTIVVE